MVRNNLCPLIVKCHRTIVHNQHRFSAISTARTMYAQYKADTSGQNSTSNMDLSEDTTNANAEALYSQEGAEAETTPRSPRKTPKSSVVIIPPADLCGQIQGIREKHDKGFIRWMPHINMLWPFYEDINDGQVFLDHKEKLEQGLANFKPFRVTFSKDAFGYFEHKKFCTLWLKPLDEEEVFAAKTTQAEEVLQGKEENLMNSDAKDNTQNKEENYVNSNPKDDTQNADQAAETEGANFEDKPKSKKKKKNKKKESVKRLDPHRENIPFHGEVVALQKQLEQIFPECDELGARDTGFKPHLSLGQFKANTVENDLAMFQGDWNEFSFEVKEVYLISREDFNDPFHVRHAVPLGGKS